MGNSKRKTREIYDGISEYDIKQNIGVGNIEYCRARYNFSVRLNKLFIEREVTQESVAKKTDLSMSLISQYRTGKGEPKITNLEKIASYFNVSVDYLLGKTDVKSIDADVISTSKYTNLSEMAVNMLHDKSHDSIHVDILSRLIENNIIANLVELIRKSLVSRFQYAALHGKNLNSFTDDEKIAFEKDEEIAFTKEALLIFNCANNIILNDINDDIEDEAYRKISEFEELALTSLEEMNKILDLIEHEKTTTPKDNDEAGKQFFQKIQNIHSEGINK